jgi:hypothetical protein
MKCDVFISYKHENADLEFARQFKSHLETQNIVVWMDERIISGENWGSSIDSALETTEIVLLVISPEAMQSAYVTYEWCYSYFSLGKELYPIYFRECSKDQGVFGRLYAHQIQIPPCLSGKPNQQDFDTIINDVQGRLEKLSDLQIARDILVNRHASTETKENAATELGTTRFHKTIARRYLLDAIDHQLSGYGNGNVQTAIAAAIYKIGDKSCLQPLERLSDIAGDIEPTRSSINAALNKLKNL